MTPKPERGLRIHYRRDKSAIAFVRFWRSVNFHWPWENADAIHEQN
jgi:hypothetical protein